MNNTFIEKNLEKKTEVKYKDLSIKIIKSIKKDIPRNLKLNTIKKQVINIISLNHNEKKKNEIG